jgi:hypothetical protein
MHTDESKPILNVGVDTQQVGSGLGARDVAHRDAPPSKRFQSEKRGEEDSCVLNQSWGHGVS